MAASLRIEDRLGGIRVIAIHHPARRNALDPGAISALADALQPAALTGVRALILRGEGRDAFCAGYDLNALAEVDPLAPGGALPDDALEEVLNRLASSPVPSIALVHGAAFGAGCDLACACDFRIGSETAVFCMPPARLGVVYAASGMARVVDLVGLPRAKRMFLTAVTVKAEEARAWGLLDALLSPEAAEAEALAWAERIAGLAPLAVRGMKETFVALGGNESSAQRDRLRALRRQAFASRDAKEGKAAFLQKRGPVFRGE